MTATFRTYLAAAAAAVAVSATLAAGQTQPPTAEQYQDALAQLRQLQADKNELATRNRDLQEKIQQLEQQRQDTAMRLETLENSVYYLREHYVAWQEFLEHNPPLRVMWYTHFTSGEFRQTVDTLLGDGTWPFLVDEQAPRGLLRGS